MTSSLCRVGAAFRKEKKAPRVARKKKDGATHLLFFFFLFFFKSHVNVLLN
jgi:hypothetical protein